MISVQNLSAAYKDKTILHNVNFQLQPGDFICLCGKNGIGKSTLLSVLANLNETSLKIINQPQITDGISKIKISELKRKDCAKKIAFMSQNEYSLWDLSVFDVILSGRFPYTKSGFYSKKDYEITENIISEMNLTDLKDRNVNSLSGGEFQKVRIARALCQQSEYILMDEPFSNLDFAIQPKIIEQLKQIAKEKTIGVLISIHDLNLAARYADKMLLLGKKCIFGTTDEVFTSENLSEIFETSLQVFKHPKHNCLFCTD